MIVTRFAPSPTGRLHLGHALSAVRARDLARAGGGVFLLRIEDIDPARRREEHVAGIAEDLRWLGLDWDGDPVRQSARLPIYAEALDRLKALGLAYPCFCTRAEIAASASAPHGEEGPVYPGTCRRLGAEVRARRMGEPHCWRLDMGKALNSLSPPPPIGGSFAVPRGERGLFWHDAAAGWIAADPLPHGDIVLARKDAPTSYHLAVTVDDAAQGVTDVMRGIDLFGATHIHRLLQALLGLAVPRYHHHPLLLGPDGKRLAKRAGATSLVELRDAGADPAAIVAALRARPLA